MQLSRGMPEGRIPFGIPSEADREHPHPPVISPTNRW